MTHLGYEEKYRNETHSASSANEPEPELPRQILDNVAVDESASKIPLLAYLLHVYGYATSHNILPALRAKYHISAREPRS